MNLKKVKRILAVSLAVMLAIPPNVYGGPLVARAEENGSGSESAAESYTVTEIGESYLYQQTYLNNSKWLKGTPYTYFTNNNNLPTTIDVKIAKNIQSNSLQTFDDKDSDEVIIEETTEEIESQETMIEEPEGYTVQETVPEGKIIPDIVSEEKEDDLLGESSKVTNDIVQEETVSEETLPEKEESVESQQPEDEESSVFSSAVGALEKFLPKPMVVHAAGSEISEDEIITLKIERWEVTQDPSKYIFTPVIEGKSTISWANGIDPSITINLIDKEHIIFLIPQLSIFQNVSEWNELRTDDEYENSISCDLTNLTYEISNSDIAEVFVDEDGDPDIHAKNPGTAIITAKYYRDAIATFEITVMNPRDGYTVINEDIWTRDKVYIRANEGYKLWTNEEDAEDGVSEIIVDVNENEFMNELYSFDIERNGEGHSYCEQTISCKIDKVAPYGIIRTVSHSWDKLVDASDAEGQEIRETTNPQFFIEGSDQESGLASIQYHIFDNYVSKDPAAIEQAVAADGGWKTFEDKWTDLDFNSYHVVYGKLTDNVGNVKYISSARMEILGYFPLNATAELRGVTDSSARIQITGEYDSDVYHYYLLNTTTDVTMSPQQVMAQGMSSRTGTFNLTGLNANTTYYVYAMIQDYDDAISDVIKVSFTTAQADTLQSISVSGIKAQAYTGKAICPKITVKDAATGKKLTQGKQYTVSYENNVNVGSGVIVITGVNGSGYEGTKRVYFSIEPQNIAKKVQAKVVGKKFLFTGDPVTPSVSMTYSKMRLTEGRDYELSYANNVAKGTATVYVTGKGNYTGTKAVKFKISGPKIKDAEVSLTADSAVYSGANSFPGVIVKYNGKTCQEGVDYTVKYPKKLKAGKNAISIIGKGNLSGSVKRNYVIEKAPMEKVEVSMQTSLQLTGKSMKVLPTSVTLDGNALTKKDYTLKYRSVATGKMSANIKAAGAYQLVLTGKGCYQGTKTVDFTVTAATDNSNTQTKPGTTVTGVGDVIDGMQLTQKYFDGIAMEDGKTVRFEVELDDADDYTAFVRQDCENQMFVGSDALAPKNKDHYTIHMAEVEYEGLNTAVRFTLKIKMDGVKEGTPVYGLWSEWDRDDKTFDRELKAVAHDGYIEVTNAVDGKAFRPYGIYIAVEK